VERIFPFSVLFLQLMLQLCLLVHQVLLQHGILWAKWGTKSIYLYDCKTVTMMVTDSTESLHTCTDILRR